MSTNPTIGILGGGQLALMMSEAARSLGLATEILASRRDDPVFQIAPQALIGDPYDIDDLRRIAGRCDVITFDHENVDPVTLKILEDEGVLLRPGSKSLTFAVDKSCQLQLFRDLQLPVPDTTVVHEVDAAIEAMARFGPKCVLKTATGGYDGKGVLLTGDPQAIRSWYPTHQTSVLVQKNLEFDCEFAVQIVRAVNGEIVAYPPVRTTQLDGMCTSVEVPSGIGAALESSAQEIAGKIAEAIDVIGLLAVEFFVVNGELVLNEIAARPHNSGHVTMESSFTSQFENHMRAVAGLPLGSTALVVPAAVMVNLVGTDSGVLHTDLVPDDVAVHLYGKTPRLGRKLGHVTAIAETVELAKIKALQTAKAIHYGEEIR